MTSWDVEISWPGVQLHQNERFVRRHSCIHINRVLRHRNDKFSLQSFNFTEGSFVVNIVSCKNIFVTYMSFYVRRSVFQFISYLFKLIFIIEFGCFGGAVLDFQLGDELYTTNNINTTKIPKGSVYIQR